MHLEWASCNASFLMCADPSVSYVLGKKHAARWFVLISSSCGSRSEQTLSAYGHLGWNLQPFGGLIGLGISPLGIMRSNFTLGSGTGIEDSSARV